MSDSGDNTDKRVLCQPVRLSERKKEQKGGFFLNIEN
jgi:hypothetical protein